MPSARSCQIHNKAVLGYLPVAFFVGGTSWNSGELSEHDQSVTKTPEQWENKPLLSYVKESRKYLMSKRHTSKLF